MAQKPPKGGVSVTLPNGKTLDFDKKKTQDVQGMKKDIEAAKGKKK